MLDYMLSQVPRKGSIVLLLALVVGAAADFQHRVAVVPAEERTATAFLDLPEADTPGQKGNLVAAAATNKKHPIHEFDWTQVTGMRAVGCGIALFISGILVSAAGIGGGGIFLAIMMLIGGISPRDAVPLSHAVVMLGAIASLLVNMRGWRTSGNVDIDLDTCRMVVPASLLGTLFGFLMNSRVPDALILKLLVVVLTFLAGIALRIWWRQRQDERMYGGASAEIIQQYSAGHDQAYETTPLMQAAGAGMGGECKTREWITPLEIMMTLLLLVLVDICSVLSFHMTSCREEKAMHHYYGSCQHPFLRTFLGRRMQFGTDVLLLDRIFFAAQWLPILLCMGLATFYANHMYSQRNWTVQRVVAVQGMGWATGVIAGLAGIGGGLIFSPFFLITMDPLIAVGTSSTCLLFIAASATFQYALTDRIMMSSAVAYGLVTFFASVCGTCLIRTVRHRLPMGKAHITLIVAVAVILTNLLTTAKLLMQTHIQIW